MVERAYYRMGGIESREHRSGCLMPPERKIVFRPHEDIMELKTISLVR